MKILRKIFLYFILLSLACLTIILMINFYVLSFSKNNYYQNVDDLPEVKTWLVFWASVKNGYPSVILEDRLKVAFEAYNSWKINKIIVSWDNSKANYNEPAVMKNYLLNLWVKKEDIYEDFAWFDTYDSLYRARDIFKIDELILFTQDFHLKRALYLAERLGIQAYWIETNLRTYFRPNYNNFREVFARIKAFFDVEIFHSKPKYLWETIKIVSTEELQETKETLNQEILNENIFSNSWILFYSWSFDEDFK